MLVSPQGNQVAPARPARVAVRGLSGGSLRIRLRLVPVCSEVRLTADNRIGDHSVVLAHRPVTHLDRRIECRLEYRMPHVCVREHRRLTAHN